jgi:hypothetical protein
LGKIYQTERVLVYQTAEKKFVRLSDLALNPASSLFKLGKELLENTPLFNPTSDNNHEAEKPERWFSKNNLPAETAAIHGFFSPGFVKDIFENPFVSLILRDPLDRMISLYNEWSQAKGMVDWRVSPNYDTDLKFTEFALFAELTNFQSKCLGKRRLGDFDLVGVAECQDGFIAQLKNKDWTGFLDQNSKEINFEQPIYKNLEITPEFLEEFQNTNQLDYAIYQQAKEFIGYC